MSISDLEGFSAFSLALLSLFFTMPTFIATRIARKDFKMAATKVCGNCNIKHASAELSGPQHLCKVSQLKTFWLLDLIVIYLVTA